MHTKLLTLLIIALLCINNASFVCADILYKWKDEKGEVQYSNKLPPEYKEDDPNVEVIEQVDQIRQGAFKKQKTKSVKNEILVAEKIWIDKCEQFNITLPSLPEDPKKALSKTHKIMADQMILVDIYKDRYSQYIKNHEKRKETYEKEMALNKEAYELKTWRPTILVATDEQHAEEIQFFKDEIAKSETILQWAKAKKKKLDSLLKK